MLTMYELRKELHSWGWMISHSPGEAIIIVNRDGEKLFDHQALLVVEDPEL
jgi:hypothetical protein